MNNELLIAILEIIKKGENFGYYTVFTEIKNDPEYFELNDETYRAHVQQLVDVECLVHIKGQPSCYALNEHKNCLALYKKKQAKLATETSLKEQIEVLTVRNLELQNKLIPDQHKELKNKRLWGAIGAVSGALLTFATEHGKEILKAAWQWLHK